eukprot:gene34854-42981_t
MVPTTFIGSYLLHRYSFNDGTAGDSISGLSATLMKGATVSNGRVNVNATAYVALPANILGGLSSLSLELWYTTSATQITGYNRILQINQAAPTITLYKDSPTGYLGYDLGSFQQKLSTIAFAGQTDAHLVFTMISGQSVKLYINGALVISNTTKSLTPASGTSGYLGRSYGDPQMTGSFNELRVWSTALSATNILQNYQNGPDVLCNGCPTLIPTIAPTATPAPSTYASFLSASLLHRYSFNDGTAKDSIGSLDGTLQSGASVVNGRVVLNPTLGSYVSLPANMWGSSTSVTLEMWVTIGATSAGDALVQIGQLAGSYQYSLYINGYLGYVNFWLAKAADGLDYVISTTPYSNHLTDTHIVMTVTPYGTGCAVRGYINGVLGASKNSINPLPTSSYGGYLGKVFPSGTNTLNGTINEFRVWSAALSADQVSQNYINGPNILSQPTSQPSRQPSGQPSSAPFNIPVVKLDMSTLSSAAKASILSIFCTYKVNITSYTGPIFNLRRSSDNVTALFYLNNTGGGLYTSAKVALNTWAPSSSNTLYVVT